MAKSRVIKGTSKSDWLTGSHFYNDIIYAGLGDDVLFGNGGDDQLFGGDGRDSLLGGIGDDLLDGGAGADHLSGGSGIDTVTYRFSDAGVYVDLLSNYGYFGDAEGDTFNSIENLTGSRHRDTLKGTDADNVIEGLSGNDTLFGNGGNDTLDGGDGNDAIIGGTGNDTIHDGAGNDILIGEAGDDLFIVGSGIDQFFGGDGIDTVSYQNAELGTGIFLDIGFGQDGDTYNGIENVIATDHGDAVFGDDAANLIDARGGNDRIADGAGDDVVIAGGGNDQIRAGAGADRYDGGDGFDELSFRDSGSGVIVSLRTGTGSGGIAEGDTYTGIEKVVATDHRDILIGDAGDNILIGGGAEDLLIGGLGDDLLTGDDPYLQFGFADAFAFEDTRGPEADVITDFEAGVDTIRFEGTDFFGFDDLTNGGDRYMEQVGNDTVIHYYDHTITLLGVATDDLNPDDFLFS